MCSGRNTCIIFLVAIVLLVQNIQFFSGGSSFSSELSLLQIPNKYTINSGEKSGCCSWLRRRVSSAACCCSDSSDDEPEENGEYTSSDHQSGGNVVEVQPGSVPTPPVGGGSLQKELQKLLARHREFGCVPRDPRPACIHLRRRIRALRERAIRERSKQITSGGGEGESTRL